MKHVKRPAIGMLPAAPPPAAFGESLLGMAGKQEVRKAGNASHCRCRRTAHGHL